MTRFGLLIPHFGEDADQDLLIDGVRLAERLSFDSIWVRDHLVFHPHGMEGTDRTFIEPFMAPVTKVAWTVHFIAEDANGVVLTERVDAFYYGDKRIALPVMGTFEFQGDKLVKWRDYFDLREFENQAAALQG